MYIQRWEAKLPHHSILFHDDDAVHDLIYNNLKHGWALEFPWLYKAMKCVFSKGAMMIDIWRLLVLVSAVLYSAVFIHLFVCSMPFAVFI